MHLRRNQRKKILLKANLQNLIYSSIISAFLFVRVHMYGNYYILSSLSRLLGIISSIISALFIVYMLIFGANLLKFVIFEEKIRPFLLTKKSFSQLILGMRHFLCE